jgi:hypothetical protein
MHFPKDVGESGFAQFAFEGGAGGAKNLLQLRLDALADGTFRIRLRSRHDKRIIGFDSAKDASQWNIAWRVRQARTKTGAAASFHQTRCLQREEQTADNHWIGIHARSQPA